MSTFDGSKLKDDVLRQCSYLKDPFQKNCEVSDGRFDKENLNENPHTEEKSNINYGNQNTKPDEQIYNKTYGKPYYEIKQTNQPASDSSNIKNTEVLYNGLSSKRKNNATVFTKQHTFNGATNYTNNNGLSLGITVGVGCALFLLNIVIFVVLYQQKDRIRREMRRSYVMQQQLQYCDKDREIYNNKTNKNNGITKVKKVHKNINKNLKITPQTQQLTGSAERLDPNEISKHYYSNRVHETDFSSQERLDNFKDYLQSSQQAIFLQQNLPNKFYNDYNTKTVSFCFNQNDSFINTHTTSSNSRTLPTTKNQYHFNTQKNMQQNYLPQNTTFEPSLMVGDSFSSQPPTKNVHSLPPPPPSNQTSISTICNSSTSNIGIRGHISNTLINSNKSNYKNIQSTADLPQKSFKNTYHLHRQKNSKTDSINECSNPHSPSFSKHTTTNCPSRTHLETCLDSMLTDNVFTSTDDNNTNNNNSLIKVDKNENFRFEEKNHFTNSGHLQNEARKDVFDGMMTETRKENDGKSSNPNSSPSTVV